MSLLASVAQTNPGLPALVDSSEIAGGKALPDSKLLKDLQT
jgi:hypothetical protein